MPQAGLGQTQDETGTSGGKNQQIQIRGTGDTDSWETLAKEEQQEVDAKSVYLSI